MALSPWPGSAAAVTAARAQLKAAIGGDDLVDARLDQLGATASALVEREAPGAPQAIRDEATIRTAGYLHQSDFGGFRAETIGPRSAEYTASHAAMFRNCGAKGLLAPWKVRNAGVIGA